MAADSRLEANKEIVRSFFTAITENRFEDAARLLAPDASWWSLARRAERPALVQLGRIQGLAGEASSGMTFRLGSLTAEDDRVSAELEGYAEFADRVYNNRYSFHLRVEGSHIVHLRMYDDTAMAEKVLRGSNPLPSHASS
jgi:ketosteroid isomerase-like protein